VQSTPLGISLIREANGFDAGSDSGCTALSPTNPLACSAARPMGHGSGRFVYSGPTRRSTTLTQVGASRGFVSGDRCVWGRVAWREQVA
jgi:hypothetical protein